MDIIFITKGRVSPSVPLPPPSLAALMDLKEYDERLTCNYASAGSRSAHVCFKAWVGAANLGSYDACSTISPLGSQPRYHLAQWELFICAHLCGHYSNYATTLAVGIARKASCAL